MRVKRSDIVQNKYLLIGGILTGLFILIFIIQLSLLPFGLPLGKFFFPFLGVEVFPNGG